MNLRPFNARFQLSRDATTFDNFNNPGTVMRSSRNNTGVLINVNVGANNCGCHTMNIG